MSYLLMLCYVDWSCQFFTDKTAADAGEKYTLVYSNIPMYTKPVLYDGKPLKRLIALGTGIACSSTMLVGVSNHKRVTLSLTTDEAHMEKEDAEKIIQMYNAEIKELGIEYIEAEEGED